MPTRKEFNAAKDIVDAYYRDQEKNRLDNLEQYNKKWVDENVGQKFLVEYSLERDYDSDCYHKEVSISFTATLVSATNPDGEMKWDNGVTTVDLLVYMIPV